MIPAPRTLGAAAAALALVACSSSTKYSEVQIRSNPPGAQVSIARKGVRNYQGKVAFIKGNVRAQPFEEEWRTIGTSPVTYSTPLEEIATDATLLGVGGRVLTRYEDAVVRIEREGFEPVEQYVRFQQGTQVMDVTLRASGPEQ